MHERRRHKRLHVGKTARIEFDGSRLDCVIRNLSDAGARLQLSSAACIPQSFVLFVTPKKDARSCEVVWSNERDLGVAFTPKPENSEDDTLSRTPLPS
jgi:hypothetical protein